MIINMKEGDALAFENDHEDCTWYHRTKLTPSGDLEVWRREEFENGGWGRPIMYLAAGTWDKVHIDL